MDYADYNRRAWDRQVELGNEWTVPVSEEIIAAARDGVWQVVLTPKKRVPTSWFPSMKGLRILGLASGGGQQAAVFAAAGAHVTVLDNSPMQLEQDQLVARRDGLAITSVLGDMRDLSKFPPDSFDLIFNPCSVCFIPDIRRVFDQSYHALKRGGRLLCGFTNPAKFIFDEDKLTQKQFHVRHKLPYSDATHLNADEMDQLRTTHEPFMWSHSLEDLITGQIKAGFTIRDMYEDRDDKDPLAEYLPLYFATLSEKAL